MPDRAIWALRAGQAAAATPPPAFRAPEGPRDCIVILTFDSGRRDPSSASLMTEADARAEAASWRKRPPAPFTPGRVTATVHRIGEPL